MKAATTMICKNFYQSKMAITILTKIVPMRSTARKTRRKNMKNIKNRKIQNVFLRKTLSGFAVVEPNKSRWVHALTFNGLVRFDPTFSNFVLPFSNVPSPGSPINQALPRSTASCQHHYLVKLVQLWVKLLWTWDLLEGLLRVTAQNKLSFNVLRRLSPPSFIVLLIVQLLRIDVVEVSISGSITSGLLLLAFGLRTLVALQALKHL
mmetsp:Transcript_11743/g.14294  ORF Transcript_11743/g.14294 Transcript_11743/m.14294 type:complete len:207 (-) Transcript_11743:102-722(-)